jgi:hypothetical protein
MLKLYGQLFDFISMLKSWKTECVGSFSQDKDHKVGQYLDSIVETYTCWEYIHALLAVPFSAPP